MPLVLTVAKSRGRWVAVAAHGADEALDHLSGFTQIPNGRNVVVC